MVADPLVTTRVSKQAFFDKDKMDADVAPLGAYHIHCLTVEARWLLATLINFYDEFDNRFINFPSKRSYDQVATEALQGLICPMTCEEDFLRLVEAVEAMAVSLEEIKDSLAADDVGMVAEIATIAINTGLASTALSALGLPDLIDKVEPMLNGVGVILGAPPIASNGS